MSKSTPINQLPTNNSENVNNSNESELVQEILKEIEDTQNLELNNPIVENNEPQNINMNIEHNEPPMSSTNQMQPMDPMQNMNNMQNMQQMNPMQMNSMQMNPMQMNPMQMNQMQMNQMPMQNTDMTESNNVVEYKSSIEKFTESLKLPAIVAMITILLSIPQLKNLIKRMIPEKFVAMGMGLTLNILLRGVLSGALFYGANLVV